MSFWTNPNLHPKTKSRFIVSFGTGLSLPNVKSVTKPSVEVQTKEYKLMNHYFNYPGLVRWQPIQIVFVDMNGTGKEFDTSQLLYDMLKFSGYAPPTTAEHGLGRRPIRGAAESPLTTPEKASTIANSFGEGLYGSTNYSPESPESINRVLRIQQIDFGARRDNDLAIDAGVIEQWDLINPIITNISWGDLDYGSDEFVECTLDIKYDWAELNEDVIGPVVTNKYQQFSN
tara:strand:+ start:4778 stop:5467 length:690 start_codon:yes stop_codon:yes gene_type:complete